MVHLWHYFCALWQSKKIAARSAAKTTRRRRKYPLIFLFPIEWIINQSIEWIINHHNRFARWVLVFYFRNRLVRLRTHSTIAFPGLVRSCFPYFRHFSTKLLLLLLLPLLLYVGVGVFDHDDDTTICLIATTYILRLHSVFYFALIYYCIQHAVISCN